MQAVNRLSAKSINTLPAGRYCDGQGLYLFVLPSGARHWIFRTSIDGKSHDYGLGPTHSVTLAEARATARQLRAQRYRAGSPRSSHTAPLATLETQTDHRQKLKLTLIHQSAALQFEPFARKYIDDHRASWSNPKHAEQWTNTLQTYVFPHIGQMNLADISTDEIVKILKPIWTDKTETATRVRSRIENILASATVLQLRHGENPAKWKNHLDKLLPNPTKLKGNHHFRALDYRQIPEFFADLCTHESVAASCLQFLILCATRSAETRLATSDEVTGDVWTIPAIHTKSKKVHVVPLSVPAQKLVEHRQIGYLFQRKGAHLSENAFAVVIESLHYKVTAHGFRASFRTWAEEVGNYPFELKESALGHVIRDKTVAAYQRGNLLEKRRLMMQDWADFCTSLVGS